VANEGFLLSEGQPKIFEISPHPLPLPSGEREGVRGDFLKNLRDKFSDLYM
jgi:hypothetical protein